MEKRFRKVYKKNIQSIIKNAKAKIERFLKKINDAEYDQKAMEIIKKENIKRG